MNLKRIAWSLLTPILMFMSLSAYAAPTPASGTPAPSAGGSGSNSAQKLFEQILDILQSLSLVVVTIAVIWAGYKILFKGVSLIDIGGPLLGAILIGSAPWVADLILQ